MLQIPLRMFQRQTAVLTDLLHENPSEWVPVVDGMGVVLFYASASPHDDPNVRQVRLASDGDFSSKLPRDNEEGIKVATKPTFEELQRTIREIGSKQPQPPEFEEGNPCALCKNIAQLYKHYEDGNEYGICSECAIRAKKNPRKMEKL